MLRLDNIKKSYTTAGFTQNALDDVSIAFRDNEFAAILGPSGSGKTTMLNVIGGLDRYDSGDLEIDNVSTKSYKDSDWDTYRNNRIGFVFQSYNLISHQSVLANVELALTLSGVSKRERRQRAIKVLNEVGLKDHIRKKPNQLSGGQMQRVAIARAIINDPEILLADEPTGALDTTTSKQVMELLTEIAKDRLVIIVTHNSELAEQYANRIVNLVDGKVKSDTNHYDPTTEDWRKSREPRKSRISFFTAIALSFSNLMTKKGRTLLTAFAGSIGIIGIATIFAFSNGINEYIKNIEEETLSVYPLVIQTQSFDLSSIFEENDDGQNRREQMRQNMQEEETSDGIREMSIMKTMFSTQTTNDLKSLKVYLEENEDLISQHVSTVHYMYDITPQIYISDTSKGIDQINPDSVFGGSMGAGSMSAVGGMSIGTMNTFSEMPNDSNLYESQYEVLAGRWPERYDEAVLVLRGNKRITDFTLFSIGVRDRDEMREMIESLRNASDTEVEISESKGIYTYDTFLNLSFKVVNPADYFQYDSIYDVWVDKSADTIYMKSLLKNSIDLKIVGIVQPDKDSSTTVLTMGVNYTPELITYLMDMAAKKQIIENQLNSPEINVLSGRTFEDERENPESKFDFSKIISVDEELFKGTLDFEDALSGFDFSAMDFSNLDFKSFDFNDMDFGGIDLSKMDFSGLDLSGLDFSKIDFSGINLDDLDFSNISIDLSQIPTPQFDINDMLISVSGQLNLAPDALTGVLNVVMSGFMSYLADPSTSPATTPEEIMEAFNEYINLPETQAEITDLLGDTIQLSDLSTQITEALTNYITNATTAYTAQILQIMQQQIQAALGAAMQSMMQSAMTSMMQTVSSQIETAIQGAMINLSSQIGDALKETMSELPKTMETAMQSITGQISSTIQTTFGEISDKMKDSMGSFDSETLAEAFKLEISEEDIYDLITSIMNPSITNYEQNLHKLGYAEVSNPSQIYIYPRSFEAKEKILQILSQYNQLMEENDTPERAIHFIDLVGLMMSSVTNIIDMVSYALVAFVSVALVVSSIMIGVITFISVLERKKEIGILRAVGASKGNIRLVFNAETLIIGFVAGVIGVLITSVIVIVANVILNNLLGIVRLVVMPPGIPVVLVIISMSLTYIAGLIPASAAARKAPVEALRSE